VALNPAVAATRLAVRPHLRALAAGGGAPLALVACSGGVDSLALAAATAFEAPRAGVRAGAVVVDHGLLEGSDRVARQAAAQCAALGLAPVTVETVQVPLHSGTGVEAAARAARHAALDRAAGRAGAVVVLLAHTLDDQAETVLLALARGAGATALAGMPPRRGRLVRPFLGVTRQETEAAVAAQGLEPWRDPTNEPGGPHPSLRAEVRARVMPALIDTLGPGVPGALARTAERLSADRDHLDAQAVALLADAVSAAGGSASGDGCVTLELDVACLARAHPAISGRALRLAALQAGAAPGALAQSHIAALTALVTRWHGQGAACLPGGIWATRTCGKLVFRASAGPIAPERQGEARGRS
jgi:tRNA(Ile)-lysidine synthase